MNETSRHRHQNDFDVESQAPILNVIEIVLNTFFEIGVAPPAVHLRPARYAGLDLVFLHVASPQSSHTPVFLLVPALLGSACVRKRSAAHA